MSIKLKQVFSGERLMEIHALYETAFPAGEKKPFSMIISGQETGLVEILSAEENDTFLGLAIMAKSGDRVLLDYFAIASERRGQGCFQLVFFRFQLCLHQSDFQAPRSA